MTDFVDENGEIFTDTPLPPMMVVTQINLIAEALAKAQGEMHNAALNQKNYYGRSYADLGSIREATVPALSKHGIALVQRIEDNGNGLRLVTSLIHASGQTLTSIHPLPANAANAQAFGSALTYARRYAWGAICGIASEADDDAEAAVVVRYAQPEQREPTTSGRKPPPIKADVVKEPLKEAQPKEDKPKFSDLVKTAAKESDYARLDQLRANYQAQLRSLKETDPEAFTYLETDLKSIYTDGLLTNANQ